MEEEEEDHGGGFEGGAFLMCVGELEPIKLTKMKENQITLAFVVSLWALQYS